MGALDKYLKPERKFEDVTLDAVGSTIKFRVPNQRELELMYKEFEGELMDKTTSSTVAVIIKLFAELPEVQSASIEEIKETVLDMAPKDIMDLLVWFYSKAGLNLKDTVDKLSEEDFQSLTGTGP